MASVASQLIEEVTAHAQTVLTFRIIYVQYNALQLLLFILFRSRWVPGSNLYQQPDYLEFLVDFHGPLKQPLEVAHQVRQ